MQEFVIKRQQGSEPLLFNFRPGTAASPVPVDLLEPVFASITTAVWSSSDDVKAIDLQRAHDLCVSMSLTYGACS